jgi:EAL domain-containing protein (putative c-di-GMP-specific phosphodiesterase class I)
MVVAVLQAVCSQGKAWRVASVPPLIISVNVPPDNSTSRTCRKNQRNIAETGPSQFLEIEVTKASLSGRRRYHPLDEKQMVSAVHRRFRRIAISAIETVPIDILKIDRSFVNGLTSDPTMRQSSARSSQWPITSI